MCIRDSSKSYVDIVFRESHNNPQVGVKRLDGSKVEFGDYKLAKDLQAVKIYRPKENIEKPFGEWNSVNFTKKGKRLTVNINGKRIGGVHIDFDKESPIGFSFSHICDVEFRGMWVVEIEDE